MGLNVIFRIVMYNVIRITLVLMFELSLKVDSNMNWENLSQLFNNTFIPVEKQKFK